MKKIAFLVEKFIAMGFCDDLEILDGITRYIDKALRRENKQLSLFSQIGPLTLDNITECRKEILKKWRSKVDESSIMDTKASLFLKAEYVNKAAWNIYEVCENDARRIGALKTALLAQTRQAKIIGLEGNTNIAIHDEKNIIINNSELTREKKRKLKKILVLQNEVVEDE